MWMDHFQACLLDSFKSHCQCFQHILHARLGTGKTCVQSIYMCWCRGTSAKQISAPQCFFIWLTIDSPLVSCKRRSPSVTSRMSASAREPCPCKNAKQHNLITRPPSPLISTPTKHCRLWGKKGSNS